jgi:hypothetical protein
MIDGSINRSTIGGDFELVEPVLGDPASLSDLTRNLDGQWTLSGRHAFALVLDALYAQGVRHLHLPAYLCESVMQPVRARSFNYSFYPVTEDLVAMPDPPSGAAVLLIHYFGWLSPVASELRRRAGRDIYLIEDISHALFSNWAAPKVPGHYLILSLRKLAPVVLGGWCNLPQVAIETPPSVEVEAALYKSLAARFLRGAYLARKTIPANAEIEELYLDWMHSLESALDSGQLAGALPNLVLRLMAGIDRDSLSATRRANWSLLDELLGGRAITPAINARTVPLGYVIRHDRRNAVRALLSERRFYCPVHWPLPKEVDAARFPAAARLSESILTLPVDQRYGGKEMRRLAAALSDADKT